MPLGPPEAGSVKLTAFAASRAFFTPSAFEISGAVRPFGTATTIRDPPRSNRLSAVTFSAPTNLSTPAREATTKSARSPPVTRCAISMVDAYSIRNFLPDAASKAGITLSNTRCIPIVTRPRGSSARAVEISVMEFASRNRSNTRLLLRPAFHSLVILLIGDLFHPLGVLAVQTFGDRDVRHSRRGSGAVPMLHSRGDPDYVSRPDLLDRPSFLLNPAHTGRDDQGLSERMSVPSRAGSRLEGHIARGNSARGASARERVDAHRAGEEFRLPSAGRLRAGSDDLHRRTFFLPRDTRHVRSDQHRENRRCRDNASPSDHHLTSSHAHFRSSREICRGLRHLATSIASRILPWRSATRRTRSASPRRRQGA